MKVRDERVEDLKLNSKRINLAENKKKVDRVPIYLTFGGYCASFQALIMTNIF
ncbi:MAG: hypothetical protein U5N58_08555 [Actinomycetota bacterium]|nr:hypothetical protein [Actinomycetota bacterium]